MAAATIVLLYVAGISLGVRLPVCGWLTMTVLILIGLIPFAVLGILIGHLLTADSMGPAIGGLTALFALLGGAWGPVLGEGALRTISKGAPVVLARPGRQVGGDAARDGRSWPGSSSPCGRSA